MDKHVKEELIDKIGEMPTSNSDLHRTLPTRITDEERLVSTLYSGKYCSRSTLIGGSSDVKCFLLVSVPMLDEDLRRASNQQWSIRTNV